MPSSQLNRSDRPTRQILSIVAAGIALAATGSANASEGVLEINQTCAELTGCFAGDAPGLPVTISDFGSYRLTSDLVTPDANTTAIVIGASQVTLDLGGFAIVRTDCRFGPTCSRSAGTGRGIDADFSSANGIGTRIHGGAIVGMGDDGIRTGPEATVEKVRVATNGGLGISVSVGSTVRDAVASDNGDEGIRTLRNSIVADSTANGNLDHGISVGFGSIVAGSTAADNAGDGIRASAGSAMLDNTAYENGGDGIEASSGSSVMRNTIRSNTGFGLRLAADAGYRENILSSSTGGTVTGGVSLFSNVCDGSTLCP